MYHYGFKNSIGEDVKDARKDTFARSCWLSIVGRTFSLLSQFPCKNNVYTYYTSLY